MRTQLNDAKIGAETRKAMERGKRLELADASLSGLRLRITPAGHRTWVLGMRDPDGRARRFALGEFPAVGIAAARERAREMRQGVRHGGADPIAEGRRRRAVAAAAARGDGTLRAVLDAYGRDAGGQLKSWPHSRLRIERVFKRLLDRPATSLTVAQLLHEADAYEAKASAAFATRTLRPVLKWAAPRELVPAAVADIKRRDPVRRRTRVLDRDELTRVLPMLRAEGGPHAAALRLMLLSLARREEVCGARWRDVDLAAGAWTIRETKNGVVHTIPLPRQAAELLASIKAAIGEPAPDDLVFRTRAGTALGNWDRETKSIQRASKTEGWHRHDLRRTGATMLGDLGILPDIVEAALNHTAIHSQLAVNYNRSRYRPQVAAALQMLADALDSIEASAATVVPMVRRAS